MKNEASSHASVTELGDYTRPRGNFRREAPSPEAVEPQLALLPDMSHTNGRGVVETVAQVLRQHQLMGG